MNRSNDNLFAWLGIAIMALAILGESTADKQKSAAKKINPKRFCDTGLYKYVRCPNYFSEVLFWIGVTVSPLAVRESIGPEMDECPDLVLLPGYLGRGGDGRERLGGAAASAGAGRHQSERQAKPFDKSPVMHVLEFRQHAVIGQHLHAGPVRIAYDQTHLSTVLRIAYDQTHLSTVRQREYPGGAARDVGRNVCGLR